MPQHPGAMYKEAERAEFEIVLKALARSPRTASLLRYMGEKFFANEIDQLTEYNIATEVFGRSKANFDAGQDAIARVEAHRLRKRLQTFYETDGRDHPIQVTLPTGGYVPLFVHKPVEAPAPVPPASSPAVEAGVLKRGIRSLGSLSLGWKTLSAVVLVLVALGSYLSFRSGVFSTHLQSSANSASPSVSAPLRSEQMSSAVRLLAGYTGNARIDSAGQTWSYDQYFSGGGTWRRAPGVTARTSDPFLFEYQRNGDFSYRIPLKPGFYELHLFFVNDGDNFTTFSISINGEYVLRGFDVNEDALGNNIADERVFRGVSPGKDGFLQIGFSGEVGAPSLSAIEILPGLPHTQIPIRLVMQTTPFTDRSGRVWHPDNYFMNGRLAPKGQPISGSSDPDLFSGERFGHFSYAIPVDTRGRYTLVLHFAEFYFGPHASGAGGVGSRVFKVMCNGETLLDNFDIFKEAGSLHELTKTFRHLKPSAQGKLNLAFEPVVNNATVSGIEVLDESK